LLHATKTLDIGLIQDDANLAAPWGEPQVKVPHLGDDLATYVLHMQADDSTIPATTVYTQAPPSPTTSQALAHPEPLPLQGLTSPL